MRETIIDFMIFITKTMSDVLKYFFIENQLKHFDPHVGDTACQIRACMIAKIKSSSKTKYDKGRITEIDRLHAKLKTFKLEAHSVIDNERNNQFTVFEFVDHIDAYFHISREEKILFQSYFLTLFKKELVDGVTVIDYDAISSHLQISRKMAKKITRHYQLSIAHESCQFVFQCDNEALTPIIDPEIRSLLLLTDDDGREVLPCYLYTKIILKYAKQQCIPLIVITSIDKVKHTICFTSNTDETFSPVDLSRHHLDATACIVVTARSNMRVEHYRKQVAVIGIEKILLCAMADHIQYTGKHLSCFAYNLDMLAKENDAITRVDLEIKEMRQLAEQIACTQYNSDLFFVDHIYGESLGRVINDLLEAKIELIC